MDNILQIVRQENIEQRFSKKLIDKKIRAELAACPVTQQRIEHGLELLAAYCDGQYYESKMNRVSQVKVLKHRELITDLFVGICYFQAPTLYTSATSQLAGRLGFSDKREAITTVAEVVAVLADTDAFDILKASKMASLTLQNRTHLSEELIEYIGNSHYLPPMVCKPLELKSNYDSGYLSHKDSLILGSGNHHDGDICLDVLNTINSVVLKLDFDFLCKCDELPKEEFTLDRVMESAYKKGNFIDEAKGQELLAAQINNWEAFKAKSQQIYLMLHSNGNNFYLTNKVDKRGRLYSQGYHVNTQGASFKKAAIELAHEELIEGVPT